MTIEELGRYRGLVAEQRAIEEELRHVYDSVVKSPSLDEPGGASPESSRTERIAMNAVELAKRLETARAETLQTLAEIEGYIQSVDDPQVRAALRMHFVCGKTWSETSRAVYGNRACKETARAACKRHAKAA